MALSKHNFSLVELAALKLRLERYLGSELAAEVTASAAPEQALFLAASQLGSSLYAVSTYLPRRLVARQLATADAGPWLEWVEGALLLADVSGSTALAERLSVLGREGTEVVTETLNCYFGTMITIIEQAGGDLLTFGGDALLVLFAGAEAARAATTTALKLLAKLEGFVREVPGIGSFPLAMHIGVEAGPVALVSAGLLQALRYSAMGRTVHQVACAEGYSTHGELVLGPRAWAMLADDAVGEPLEAGFVRVRTLARPAVAQPDAALLAPLPSFTLATLDELARRLDRTSPYLPAHLLARILADPTRPSVEADLRPVSVLFAQISGLGDLVERLAPATAAAVVDAFLRPLHALITRLGGVINKLDLAEEGDKLLAVFGAPIAYEDHAERAARAALLMIDEGRQMISQSLRELIGAEHAALARLRFRIGLNTGNVFAGNVGSTERKEYTVMGDAVNVAARVMTATAWGEVRCSAATARLVRHVVSLDDPQSVLVKGKQEPLALLRLVGLHEVAGTDQDLPLIGREGELRWLRERLAAAAGGRGQVVRVRGEAGIGKSRLGAALCGEVQTRVISVRCLDYNRTIPYTPWGEVLRELCAISAGDSQAVRINRLSAVLNEAGLVAEDWLPLLAELAHIDVPSNAIMRTLDPAQRQERRFELITALLAATARRTAPLLLLLDNLHWADHVSLDLWQYVAAHLADAPILLLGLHRGMLAWGSGHQEDNAEVIELGPLDAAASATLLATLAEPAALNTELRERLVARAAGNPLFLEELLRAVEREPEALDALPDSLSGLLLARIDRLDEPSRTLLRLAAVVGQRFPLSIVQSIQVEDIDALVRRLVQLEYEELTATERERPERIHLFRQALVQEVAYQSLLYARRRELHRRIAEHLEALHASELSQVRGQYSGGLVQIGRNGSLLSRATRAGGSIIFLLAHHYRHSDQAERALPYLLLAGHIARDDHANDQAIQHYRWALAILGERRNDPRSWEAREALGDVLCILGRYEEAFHEYATILTPAEAGEALVLPPSVEAETLRSWGDALEKQGRYQEALDRLRAAETICREHLDAVPPLLISAIYADMGQVLRRLGALDEALAMARSGLARLRNDRRSSEDERIEADLQQLLGTLYAMRGDYGEARFHFENALAAQEAIDDLYGCARSHNNLGYLAQYTSNYALAVRHYGEAETLARKISAKYVLSSVLLNAAYGYYRLDRYAEAEEACCDALALCSEMGDQLGVAQAADTLGLIAYSRGAYAEAISAYAKALAIYRSQQSTYQEGNTLAMLAMAHSAAGTPDLATTYAEQALALARQTQVPQLETEALAALAEATLARVLTGSVAHPDQTILLLEAAELAHSAANVAARLGSKLDQGIALRLQGEIAAQRGEPFMPDFLNALSLLERAGSAFETARAQARLGAALATTGDPAAASYLLQAVATFKRIGADGELRRSGI